VNDVDLFSNIAADDESDDGIDTYDKASTNGRCLLVHAVVWSMQPPPELISN
jgi:hypothetical protein